MLVKWLPGATSLAGVIQRNPNRTNSVILYGLIAALVAVGLYFWVDYRSAKANLAEVRSDLRAEQALTAAQGKAITKFQAEQARYAELVRQFDSFRAEVNAEVRELRRGLTAREIEEAAADDPVEATREITDRVNRAFRMFDDATSIGGSGGTDANRSPPAGTDPE